MNAGLLCVCRGGAANGQSDYFNEVFFDNSLTPDRYYHSRGKAFAPSSLQLINGKLPVDASTFRTPPNALRLAWTSVPNGSWEAEVRLYEWRNREVYFPGNMLCFSIYPAAEIGTRRFAAPGVER